jgi:bifunctional DNA-binding transcriptional regulator/antitoxin component of YhaV-PrlF toxin-antitoxin module
MLKRLDLFLCLIGFTFIVVVVWDCYKSASHLPEGLWYVLRRTPDAYPAEIRTDINQIQVTADQKLEARSAEIAEEIRKQIEDSNTGCISFSGLPNAVCFGAKQTASP